MKVVLALVDTVARSYIKRTDCTSVTMHRILSLICTLVWSLDFVSKLIGLIILKLKCTLLGEGKKGNTNIIALTLVLFKMYVFHAFPNNTSLITVIKGIQLILFRWKT